MGLEEHATGVLEEEGWSNGTDFIWEDNHLKVDDTLNDSDHIGPIMSRALNYTGDFSSYYNPETKMIEFNPIAII